MNTSRTMTKDDAAPATIRIPVRERETTALLRQAAMPVLAALLVAGTAATSQAASPRDLCQAGKLKASGKFAQCRLIQDSKAVLTGTTADYTKCHIDFSAAEKKGAGECPSETDVGTFAEFIDACTMSLAVAIGGGILPLDVLTCNEDLLTCQDDLSMAGADLDTCNSGLATCSGDLGTCGGDLSTCQGDLSTTNADLGACNSGLATCSGDLGTCQSDLGTCQSDLTATNADLGTCNTNLSATSADLSDCQTDLGTANSGTAAAGDVLAGKIFTSAAGIGATGTMPNNGGVMLTPTTSNQAIAAGYHNGSGICAGDAELVAGNIKVGVNLFGVTGTARQVGLPKTGQTTCYDPAGTVIPCAGTGQDGELQKGVANSFTDNGDGTVTDSLTGLMWEKLSDDFTIHDKNDYYTWEAAFGKVAILNATLFAGYSDWRLPNRKELETLLNLGATNPATFSVFNSSCRPGSTLTTGSCTLSHFYWSSSTEHFDPSNAWSVDLGSGNSIDFDKTYNFYVRAVRGGS